ncbi:hypothetical protein GW17_00010657 [Ensete ventricosum]|nr:hypothetical protein GW17_00010657 [Ensete ventricosum]RZR98419.1 hypothetical protein BHM03_00027773 [Ensete ventricosum]
MDISYLRGMPKVTGGKPHATRAATPAREVEGAPSSEALRPFASTPKRPFEGSVPEPGDATRGHKRAKTLSKSSCP